MNRRQMFGTLGIAGLVATGRFAHAQAPAQPPARGTRAPAAAQTPHAEHAAHPQSAAEMTKQMQSMNKMMVEHLGDHDAEFELRFIELTIPHHEGMIAMAKHALQHSNRPEVKEMAEKAIKMQQAEIETLKKWRKEWYAK